MLNYILDEHNPAPLQVELAERQEGLEIYTLSFTTDEPVHDLSLTLRFPMLGILNTFQPMAYRDRSVHQWFRPTTSASNFAQGAPVVATLRDDGKNAVTVALSDAVNAHEIQFYVQDFRQQEENEFRIRLLTGLVKKKSLSLQMRIDTRPLPFAQSMAELSDWWERFYPYRYAQIPEGAEDPLYSSWYNFHQHPNAEVMLPDLKAAAALGFKTVIIDDGWQYDGNGTGDYVDCGDWAFSKEKFPDFPGFVRDVHALGMKLMLWFPVPFVGFHTRAYEEFQDRLLYRSESLQAGVLDPRYESVRSFIIETLCKLALENDLDGLKLDFVDSFQETEETPAANALMDEPDLSLAVIRLLEDLETALRSVRDPMLLEYRQNYVGPAITRFGSMLRVGDCAFDAQTNRIGIADLRLLHYRIAVHSDMLFWSKTETPENCARQMLNVLFSVPQISVLLQYAGEAQKQAIAAFLRYWTAHRETLLHGGFIPTRQDLNYPVLEARDADRRIIALYAGMPVTVGCERFDLHNATPETRIVVRCTCENARDTAIYDCMGQKVRDYVVKPGLQEIEIPVGGRMEC